LETEKINLNNYQITPPVFSLPKQLAELGNLAYNLWWSWNPEALRLYRRIDPVLGTAGHNPVLPTASGS
jgi:starch phosphorylase